MNAPWRIATTRIIHTKHFEMKYASTWQWHVSDTREAIAQAYLIAPCGDHKFETYTHKNGWKKIIAVYEPDGDRLILLSGSTGGGMVR